MAVYALSKHAGPYAAGTARHDHLHSDHSPEFPQHRGAVICVLPHLAEPAREAIAGRSTSGLDDALCDTLQRALDPLINVQFWFRGFRLYCEPGGFIDQSFGEVRDVADQDESAWHMRDTWGGPVFGQVVDGRVVTWSAIKPLSETVWDLTIETRKEYRGRGYARSAVSAAVKHCFENGRLVGWGCDRDNVASLRTALSVGFRHYALDFGCKEKKTDGN
jgi:RimJ/RimL family protein N-acetyltransferase